MGNADNFQELDYAMQIIGCKARQLVRRLGFRPSDREDLEQEIAMHLFQQLQDYDPERGSVRAFVVCVVKSKVCTIIRARNKRIENVGFSMFSLNESVPDEDGCLMQRLDAIDREDYLLCEGLLSRPTLDLREMRVDIERVLDTLPPPMREICERLKTQNVTQISSEMGASRQHIYDAIRKLRAIFDEAGLRDYL